MSDEQQWEQSRRMIIDAYLASRIFQRSFGVLDVYQQLLQECHNNTQSALIKERMRTLFNVPVDEMMGEQADDDGRQLANEMVQLRVKILTLAESGQLTIEKMAGLLAGSTIAEEYLESLNPQPDSVSETGNVRINEVIEYFTMGENAEILGINLMPTQVVDLKEIKSKAVQGVKQIAELMKDNGSLNKIKKVKLSSWLFDNPRFAGDLQSMFAGRIEDEDDEKMIGEVQWQSLSFNKQAIKNYLLNGEKPKVRKVVLSREEFINQFGS